jgi:uncharacterized protein (DUF4415 family)
MKKIVKNSPRDRSLTAGRRRRLERLSLRPDRETDTSDLPELTEKFWQNAVRNPFYRPVKKQLTLRLDADIITWLRRQGKGYQTRANALLREAMLGELNSKGRKAKKAQARKNPLQEGMVLT